DFELRAELRWGPKRKPKDFSLSPRDGLISHAADTGMYVPPELAMFVELFRKKISGWDITEETDILPLGNSMWIPDYRLVHQATQKRCIWRCLVSGGAPAWNPIWHACEKMPRRHSSWPFPNNFTWRKPTWIHCPPASIAFGTCLCLMKLLNWRKHN